MQNIKLNITTNRLLYLLLLSPILAYLYTVHLALPKNIAFFFVFVVFCYGIVFVLIKNRLVVPLFAKFILFFALYRMISQFFHPIERHLITDIYHHILYFVNFLAVVIIYNTYFNDKFIERTINIIKITVVLAGIVSIIQVFDSNFLNPNIFFGKDMDNLDSIYTIRRTSIFGLIHPLSLGLSFVPLLSILIGYMLHEKKNFIIFLLIGGLVTLLSNTRFIMIGFILITMQVVIQKEAKMSIYIKPIVTITISIFICLLILQKLGYDFKEWYQDRLMVEGNFKATTRYEAIGNFLKFFPEKPLFGTGGMTSAIKEASLEIGSSQIHVGYLQALVFYGVIGCFFLFTFYYLLARRLYKLAKVTNYWGSFFSFLVFLWAFTTQTHESIFFYGLLFSLVFDKYYFEKYSKSNAYYLANLNKNNFQEFNIHK